MFYYRFRKLMENVFWFKNLKIIYKGYLLERSRDDYV